MKHQFALEDSYDLEDERPRNHGGRYIPTEEERRRWTEQRRHRAEDQAYTDHRDTIDDLLVGLHP